ncbi:MAG: hypothetical protein HXY46_04680 [Syntrophaceae bacterium]|nr:hypothetical protein [Syntrophaceae bacterium]
MDEMTWVKLLDEAIPLFLLLGLGFVLYRGFRRNQNLLSEREALLKRYLLFRGDKQVRLKIYGDDENIRSELLKNISNSWKNFKRIYDQCLLSLGQNTTKTKRLLYLITLGLLINSTRHFAEAYFFFSLKAQVLHILARELSYYVLVIIGFFLLRSQTHKFLSMKGEAVKVDREILFFPNGLSAEGDQEVLYNEFDPLETAGGEDGKEDQNPGQ